MIESSNIIFWFWAVMTIGVCTLQWPMLFISSSSSMPAALQNLIRYGKLGSHKDISNHGWCHVPKRYFTHYYIIATLWNGFLTAVLLHGYYFNKSTPFTWLGELFDFLTGPRDGARVDALSAGLGMTMLFVHVARRLYECLFVSVYSQSTMSWLTYIIGCAYYLGLAPALLSLAEGFPYVDTPIRLQFHWWQPVGIALFLWANWHHHTAHVILARLRKDSKGRVKTLIHCIPSGDWFDLVSCPHFLAEILIYLALAMTMGLRHYIWWMVVVFVVANQAAMGIATHRWYQATYTSYPPNRKAIFPHVL
ncbi:PREDICTED: polyprenol reductase-like [Priapulus caudatus]|uniref:Polyprenal reductase n=1 Tax=Priapulus caudatus TaxID=37621 RepID=A0ABM1EAR4_PRICU|nr:PREDICTED: polyprenol reductase-like [Priapulus caudatus]